MKKKAISADKEAQEPTPAKAALNAKAKKLRDPSGSVLFADQGTSVEERLSVCPTDPGVYLMKDQQGHVLYVGKAKNLRARVRSYFQDQLAHSAKTQHLVARIRDLEFYRVSSETEALLLENTLIKKWKPKYNLRLKDDKTYPYLKLDLKHPYPRPYIARRQSRGDGNEYFGPYPFSGALRSSLQMAAKVFQIRDCRDHEFANRVRPCLSYEIGQCTAPCVGLVTHEQYAAQVSDFRAFLRGERRDLEERWEKDMEAAAENLDFEKAARLRDRLSAIRNIMSEQRMVDVGDLGDRDVWALWPEGEELSRLVQDGTGGEFSVLILQFREGKWVGQSHRPVEVGEGILGDGFLAELLLQHYGKNLLPAEILLPSHVELPPLHDLAQALGKVSLESGLVSSETMVEVQLHRADEKSAWIRLEELARENVRGLHLEREKMRNQKGDGLEALAKMLDLPRVPEHMECVDISNLQGEANVASCVVFRHGRPEKSLYRHYKIAGFSGQNDFASMREVMSRRYGKPDSPIPDLLVIDGGKGQLQAALEILKGLGQSFPVVGLAKARTESNFAGAEVESSEERVFLPNQKNYVRFRHPEALKIMTQLRDEAHRFAIEFHRKKRSEARGL